jgi:hypothetical protein
VSDAHSAALRIRRLVLERGYARLIAAWAKKLAASCAPPSVRRLLQLIELADGYDATITLRTRDFVHFVREEKVEEASPSPVRVMTVHAAKGLEFDAVVLPELDRTLLRMTDVPAYVERATPVSPIHAVYAPAGEAVRALCPQLEAAHAQMLESRLRDDLSVLYVAMTRPRHALHLIVKPLAQKKDGSPKTGGWSNLSYATMLRRVLGPEGPTFGSEEILFREGDAAWTKLFARSRPMAEPGEPLRPRLALPAAASRRTWAVVAPSSLERGGRVRAADVLAPAASTALLRGSVLHAWFERVGFVNAAGADGLPPEGELLAAAEGTVRRLGLSARGAGGEAWLRPLLAEFHRMLAHPVVAAAPTRFPAADELCRVRH